MDRAEYDACLTRLDRNERAMLVETRRLGKASASMMRHVTRSPKTGKPLEYGLSRELTRLQELGLLRRVKPERPQHYEAVPIAEVEEAAKVFELRKRRRRRRRSLAAKIDDLRKYEHGDYSEFYRVHRRVHELTEYVGRHITKMAYWQAAPKDDLAQTARDLADLQEALDQAFVCLKQRAEDDDLLAKIEKLSDTTGRTREEAKAFQTMAARLRTQYDHRVGP